MTTNNTSNRANSENIKSHDSKKIIGVWADDFNDGVYHRIIESPKGVFPMEIGDKRRWIEQCSLKRIIKNGVTIYKNSDYGYDDYYIINQDNNLEVFDNYGYIATYKRTTFVARLKTLCHTLTDYRTIVEDFYKVVEFVEWLKENYPDKA